MSWYNYVACFFAACAFPGQFCASFRALEFPAIGLSNSVCSPSRKRIVLSHRKCSVGLCESFGGLLVVQGRPGSHMTIM